ncbi:TetR/AcrR family transcriptional regulator [Streptomyces pini]|uniref:Transcriptional regulator, TetR family n=1 Tax=Streptomyces pini TaxID=1520580 RepID=A0A1I4DF28_9ACTN|nr:TetR/AcrR family transcriptional regulator [Streptomyces pini]SFK91509.1 transcriptional regulator, TetR family [Streptomyces pini]
MGQKGEETRGRLLDAAQRLIESGGYFGAGLNQVVAASGAPKGSLYFHFPGGKDQLVEESVRQGGREIARLMADLGEDAAHRRPAEMLTALVGLLAHRLEESGWRKGCPVATVALEMAATSPELQKACSEVYRSWEAALAERLAADGHPAPGQAATTVLCLIEGALVLAKAHRSREPLDRAAHSIASLL